jgi:hypothetical protein
MSVDTATTRAPGERASSDKDKDARRYLALTIQWHPNVDCVGETAVLSEGSSIA